MSDDNKLEEKENIYINREEDEEQHWPAFMLMGLFLVVGLVCYSKI